jgi:glycerol-3-phosphate dehydrogenase
VGTAARRAAVAALGSRRFDLVVVGAGVHGAFAAWDAALRGLSVALIDRGDFGGATSANSLRIVHGGLRYLQRMDVARARESAGERAAIVRLAPGLVRPLPCVLPARSATQALTLAAGLGLYALLTLDIREERELRRARLLSRATLTRLAGFLASPTARAGVLWHDALLLSPERVLLAVVRAAVAAGATALNHVEATALVTRHGRAAGVRVTDHEGGGELVVDGRAVLNAAGPWAAALAGGAPLPRFARAWNVVVRRPPAPVAVAVPHPREGRYLFAVPGADRTVLGTAYAPADQRAPAAGGGDPIGEEPRRLLEDFNRALPGLELRPEEVTAVHEGRLPAAASADGRVLLLDRPVLLDHARAGGPAGLVTMVGVKWTTGRAVAARAVDLCQRSLGVPVRRGVTDRPPAGGTAADPPGDRLTTLYGGAAVEVRHLADDDELARPLAPGCPATAAEVVHAVRNELAARLDDILLRRLALGDGGYPGDEVAAAAGAIAARELGWAEERLDAERRRLRAHFPADPPRPTT